MGDKEVVKIRCATAEDYDGVMAIDDNVYEGTDYLPARYFTYLDTINRVLAVAIVNGEIVRMKFAYVLQSLANSHSRIHYFKGFKQRNLASNLFLIH